MHIRNNAQRQHIIDSLDGLLYQMHILSYFMSPSLLILLARCTAQLQIVRPRTVDPQRSLRFWYFIIVLFNAGSLWSHAAIGASEGRAIILDFVGMAFEPSKPQLLSLDTIIVVLSLILTTISFETSYIASAPGNSPDTLTHVYGTGTDMAIPTSSNDSLVLDIRLSHFIKHIRNPPPPPSSHSDSALLPLPNTTAAALPRALRAVIQARAAQRARQQRATPGLGRDAGEAPGRVPGAIDDPD